jgi:transcriptional regulator with XRE-family HTH domain
MINKNDFNDETIKYIIASNLKKTRIELRLKQENVSSETGITNISKHESGDISPDLITLIKYAKFYNVGLDYICGIDINITSAEKIYETFFDYLKPKNENDMYIKRYDVLTLSIYEPLVEYFKTVTKEYLHKRTSEIDESAFEKTLDKTKEKLYKALIKNNKKSSDYVLMPINDLEHFIETIYPHK